MPREAQRARAALCLLVLAACGRPAAQAPDASAPPPPREVETARPEAAPFPLTVLLQGTLEAEHQVELAARVDGPVTAVLVDLGDEVRQGQTLARIDPADFRARAAQAHAELAQAEADLERFTGMAHPEAVARQTVDTARTRVETARAGVALASRQVTDANVRAPFAGAIVRRLVERGAYVRVGTPLFEIVSTGNLRLGLEIPERHLGAFDVGAKIFVMVGEHAEPRFEAEVVRMAPAVSPATRTFRIEAEVEPTHPTLRPGAFVVAALTLGTAEDAVRVPRGAVFSALGKDRVIRLANGVADPRDIELLGEREGYAYVRGISPSDTVVLGNVSALAPGTRLRPRRTGPTAAAPASGDAR